MGCCIENNQEKTEDVSLLCGWQRRYDSHSPRLQQILITRGLNNKQLLHAVGRLHTTIFLSYCGALRESGAAPRRSSPHGTNQWQLTGAGELHLHGRATCSPADTQHQQRGRTEQKGRLSGFSPALSTSSSLVLQPSGGSACRLMKPPSRHVHKR